MSESKPLRSPQAMNGTTVRLSPRRGSFCFSGEGNERPVKSKKQAVVTVAHVEKSSGHVGREIGRGRVPLADNKGFNA